MQPYYRLMKSILFVLFLSFGMISCEKDIEDRDDFTHFIIEIHLTYKKMGEKG